MVATVSSISKHKNYEHAYFYVYRKWINSVREEEYRSKGWALGPVPTVSPECPNIVSSLYYEGLLKAYRIKLEFDSINAFLKGGVLQKPEILEVGEEQNPFVGS